MADFVATPQTRVQAAENERLGFPARHIDRENIKQGAQGGAGHRCIGPCPLAPCAGVPLSILVSDIVRHFITPHAQRTLPAPRLKSMIQINAVALLPPTIPAWHSIRSNFGSFPFLETAGIATVIVSALLIAGIAYSIW